MTRPEQSARRFHRRKRAGLCHDCGKPVPFDRVLGRRPINCRRCQVRYRKRAEPWPCPTCGTEHTRRGRNHRPIEYCIFCEIFNPLARSRAEERERMRELRDRRRR